jgi:D-alanyl-D-alanine endopeptidase (penicillin-binding protein 7)
MKFKPLPFFAVLASFLFLALALNPLAAHAADLSNFQMIYQPEAFPGVTDPNTIMDLAPANLPWQWQALTPAYQYFFTDANMYDPSRPMTIKINYDRTNNYYKQIFSYDSASQTWRAIPTVDYPAANYVTALTTAAANRLILLANPDTLTVGTASWYKYKGGMFAASPDFKKGSVIRVYNLDNDKFVDVIINDYGPDRAQHPDRVIDLDKVAFQAIASPSDGLVKVRIEPRQALVLQTTQVAAPASTQTAAQGATPAVTAKGAIIVSEKDGQVLYSKKATTTAPLASLTKLVAMKVFLETKPSLKQVVTYKTQDEKYNYAYCKPGEAAQLKVKAGETMKVEDLIYSTLVGSANNAMESLVRVSGLTRAEFIKRMNTMVKKWGAKQTNFIEPTGLAPENVSSPYDYAIIAKEVFTDPYLKKVTTAKSYQFKTINTKKLHTIKNTNKLVRDGTYPLAGSKTGYLIEAGHCLMTRVTTAKGNIIVVNFGSDSASNNLADNEQLIRYGQRLIGAK